MPQNSIDYSNNTYWQIDVWAAGVTLLEIAIGFPVWLQKKSIITMRNHRTFLALAGVMNFENLHIRNGLSQLLKAQQHKFDSEDKVRSMMKRMGGSYGLYKEDEFVNLIFRMLQVEHDNRISPREILEHPFLVKDVKISVPE